MTVPTLWNVTRWQASTQDAAVVTGYSVRMPGLPYHKFSHCWPRSLIVDIYATCTVILVLVEGGSDLTPIEFHIEIQSLIFDRLN